MGFKNFRIGDLSSANLQTLINDLETAVSNGEYTSIEQFAKDFAKEIKKTTIQVNKNGVREVEVGSESVNLRQAVTQIHTTIEKTKEQELTDVAKTTEYLSMWESVESQLTALFKQEEMMDELINRGFKPEEFKKSIEAANKRSDELIGRLNTRIKEKEKEKKDVLGDDFKDPLHPSLTRKSLPTKLQDYKDAKGHFESITEQLGEIEKIKQAIKQLKDDIANDPSLEGRLSGNIQASERELAQLCTNVTDSVTSLENLQISDIDLKAVKNIDFNDSASREDAFLYADSLLNPPVIEGRINDVYTEIADKIISKGKVDPAVKAIIEKIKSGVTPTADERIAAHTEIEKYMQNLDKDIETAKSGKRQEEVLKIARTKSVEEYEKMAKREKDLEDKFDIIEEDELDADGNPTGNRIQRRQAKPAVEQAYLADYDEEARKNELAREIESEETRKETEFRSMGYREKRAHLKSLGIGNWFTRIFPTNLLSRRYSEVLGLPAGEIEDQVKDRIEIEKTTHIISKERADLREYEDASAKAGSVRHAYDSLVRQAPIQSKMQDGAYDRDIVRDTADAQEKKNELISSMQGAGYEQISLLYAEAILKGQNPELILPIERDRKVLEETRKKYDYTAVVERHTDVRKNTERPVHKDRDDGDER